MRILAIDPGSEKSAYVVYEDGKILEHDIVTNKILLLRMDGHWLTDDSDGYAIAPEEMAIEMVASYGMPVGKSVFETCVWIGRIIEHWHPRPATKVYRKTDICMHLCHSTRAKDSNIRQAIIDLYPATGGGKCPQIGIKSKPGPLYGVSEDVWAALGVAITFSELYEQLIERK